MMKNLVRSLTWISILCLMASTASAIELPSFHFFEPFPDDLSRWYLGNIFGSDLVPGANTPNIRLLGLLFGIFNQVVLVVAIIIISYTIATGTLNTAAEGKPLGQKWNAVWLPIRIVGGITFLVPKAGTGYCLAQYVVMWLILQGIGAADLLWGTMLDYFEAGGAIKTQTVSEKTSIFTYDNMNYTYALQTDQGIGGGAYGSPTQQPADLLKSMVCIEAHNNDPANVDLPKWKPYLGTVPSTPDVLSHPMLMFGDPKQYNVKMPVNDNQSGSECGYVQYRVNFEQSSADIKKESEKATIYMNGLLLMADQLEPLAKMIVTTSEKEDGKNFPRQYMDVQRSMQLYVNYIASYRNLLGPVRNKTNDFSLYKQFGWILAGNYYSVLTNFQEKEELYAQEFVRPYYDFEYAGPISSSDPNGFYPRASSFYSSNYFTAEPEPMYAVPGSEYMISKYPSTQPISTGTISPINRSKAEDLKKSIAKHFNSDHLSGETKDRVDEFMKYLTGEGEGSGLSAQNPIMSAAKYGKMLTEIALVTMMAFGAAAVYTTTKSGKMAGMLPFHWAVAALLNDMLTPMILALCAFLYAQGSVLGVFVPLIPYMIFLTGVIGFMMTCVEAVAAAPLVAMGLIFPETKDEIWGRAAPAYMLILNLFLRPSLMIIGFGAAMILMWVTTEILNIGFITLMAATFAIEGMFGFVTIVTAYVAIFTYMVSEVYSLINVVPNRVLAWIGDQSMGVKPSKDIIAAAKQGAEAGTGAVEGGLESSQKADMWRAQEHAEQYETAKGPGTATSGGKDQKDASAVNQQEQSSQSENRTAAAEKAAAARAAASRGKPGG